MYNSLMRAYSNDLRERIFRAAKAGESIKSVAKVFEVSVGWVYKILARYRQTGSYAALPYNNGAPRKLSEEDLQLLRKLVQEQPDASLQELKEKGNFTVSLATIHRALRNQLKITYKKNSSRQRTKPS
jgi:transposase